LKLFECDHCGQPLFFENTRCERCAHELGYVAEKTALLSLEPSGDAWCSPGAPERRFLRCINARYDACNWLVPEGSPEGLCAACRHNRTIPDLAQSDNLARFRRLELAKHRLFYSLLRLGLKPANRSDDPQRGLAFDFLAESEGTPQIMTGHADGVITISAAEADGAERERRRGDMGEAYRTLLGHFRHESGHYFWDVLVRERSSMTRFRELFGDERRDYGAAIEAHYASGPPADWQQHFVTAYASTHPWEDFAETWAHFLHIVDTLETAASFGLSVHPQVAAAPDSESDTKFDPYRAPSMAALVERWLPLTFAVNSLNRSMGQPDLYPFVLSPVAIEKLDFVRRLVWEAGTSAPASRAVAAPALA
jgi:hypothetical protein